MALGQALLQITNDFDFRNWSAFHYIAQNGNTNLATKVIDIVGNYYDNLNTEEQTKVGCKLIEACQWFVLNEDVQNFKMMFSRFKIAVNTELNNILYFVMQF